MRSTRDVDRAKSENFLPEDEKRDLFFFARGMGTGKRGCLPICICWRARTTSPVYEGDARRNEAIIRFCPVQWRSILIMPRAWAIVRMGAKSFALKVAAQAEAAGRKLNEPWN